MTDSPVPPDPPHRVPDSSDTPIGKPRSVGLTILISIVTLGIWTWVWSYMNGEELKNYRRDGLGGVAYLLLTIFISPVTMFLMANEVEKLYVDAGGAAADHHHLGPLVPAPVDRQHHLVRANPERHQQVLAGPGRNDQSRPRLILWTLTAEPLPTPLAR